jgi:hypothetical protein
MMAVMRVDAVVAPRNGRVAGDGESRCDRGEA